jgi:hypothetical protein
MTLKLNALANRFVSNSSHGPSLTSDSDRHPANPDATRMMAKRDAVFPM